MKKALILAFCLLFLASCAKDVPAINTESPAPTATPVVKTPEPTVTPGKLEGEVDIERNTKGENFYASDGAKILTVTISLPEVVDDAYPEAAAIINSYYQSQQEKHLHYAETERYEYAIYSYTNSSSAAEFTPYTSEQYFTVEFNERGYISFCRRLVETSGESVESSVISETFEVSSGGLVTGSYLYTCSEEEFTKRVTDAIIEQIDGLNGSGFYPDYEQLVRSAFIPDCFYLTPDGIAYYFQTYELAGEEMGSPVFIIPYEDVEDIFRLW
ncbi:MAG: RsiV family protein [Oscillospiraceae bacterium]|jgi:hypothetical protein